MSRILRSKLFISIILLICAGFLTFWVLPQVNNAKSETVTVVQMIEDVNAGTRISETMVTTKEIGKYGVDNAVITKKDDVVGKYAATNIRRGTNVYSDMFVNEFTQVDGALDSILKPTDRLVTVTLPSAAAGMAKMLKPGSVVDVLTQQAKKAAVVDEYGYAEEDDTIIMEQVPLMQNVVVYKIYNNALDETDELQRRYTSLLEANDGSEEDFDSSMIPVYVTLIVNDEQALKLGNQEYNGNIHLVLHPTEEYTADGIVQVENDNAAAPSADNTSNEAGNTPSAVDGDNTPAEGEANTPAEGDADAEPNTEADKPAA